LNFREIFGRIAADPHFAQEPYLLGLSLAGFVGLCLFIGAVGKSAQIPLLVWLPDAMAGPTPVSALIHAATMVTAGVYMVARSNVIYQLTTGVSTLVAVVGCVTAIFAATIGLAQTDIKKVLAYSTVSQLGFMFLAAGVGAYGVAIFHLMTHAFFKGLMFLGSGSVIHAMGGEQDMRKMGGLRKYMPTTYWTFLVGALAIAGVPFFAGFFSKDQILASVFGGHKLLWVVGMVTAGLTALYMFRLVFMTFWGEFRGSEDEREHLHESPPVMTVPLVVLAVGAAVSGWVGWPQLGSWDWNWIGRFLAPVVVDVGEHGAAHHTSVVVELELMALSVLVSAVGIWLAWKTYGGDKGLAGGESWAERYPAVHRLLVNKYWVDEIYDEMVVRPLRNIARFCWKVVDAILIEGAVHTGPFITRLVGDIGRFTTTGNVRDYALYFFVGLILLFWWLVA
jgi:NADH-quinone oxidoreductase subunit L